VPLPIYLSAPTPPRRLGAAAADLDDLDDLDLDTEDDGDDLEFGADVDRQRAVND
jgi:hypothetical protein